MKQIPNNWDIYQTPVLNHVTPCVQVKLIPAVVSAWTLSRGLQITQAAAYHLGIFLMASRGEPWVSQESAILFYSKPKKCMISRFPGVRHFERCLNWWKERQGHSNEHKICHENQQKLTAKKCQIWSPSGWRRMGQDMGEWSLCILPTPLLNTSNHQD